MTTKIEWTRGDDGSPGVTWNPVTGCTKVSQGCKNCYAERLAPKVFAGQMVPVDPRIVPDTTEMRKRVFTDVRLHPDRLEAPLHWRKPRRVFVNSMSDLFHEDVSFAFIEQVHDVIRECRQHTFQILTKRPARLLDYWRWRREKFLGVSMTSVPPENAWYGVSVEDQATADERIPLLLQTPAAVRFLSCEPLLGPVDIERWLRPRSRPNKDGYGGDHAPGWTTDLATVDWVIVGSESGPGARAMNIEWARSIVDQCSAAGVACFVKQIASANDRKGGNPEHWPSGHWPREFPR